MSVNLSNIINPSGIDTEAVIKSLLQRETKQIEDLKGEKDLANSKIGVWKDLATQLKSFDDTIKTLISEGTTGNTLFNNKKVSSSNEGVLSALANHKAAEGSFNVNVTSLASAQVVYGNQNPNITGIASGDISLNGATISIANTDTLDNIIAKINESTDFDAGHALRAIIVDSRLVLQTESGAGHLIYGSNGTFGSNAILQTLGIIDSSTSSVNSAQASNGQTNFTTANSGSLVINGATISFATGATLRDIAKSINVNSGYTPGQEVFAGVVGDSSNERLVIHTKNSTQSVNITDGGGTFNLVTAINLTGNNGFSIRSEGAALFSKDLQGTINGVPVSNAKNNLNEALPNITLSIHATGSSTINIVHDTEAIVNAVKDFVDSYNSTRTLVNNLRNVKLQDTDRFGVFFSDTLMRDLYNEIRRETSGVVRMGDQGLWGGVTVSAGASAGSTTISLQGFPLDKPIDTETYLSINGETYHVEAGITPVGGVATLSLNRGLKTAINIGDAVEPALLSVNELGIIADDTTGETGLEGILKVDDTLLRTSLLNNLDRVRHILARHDAENKPYDSVAPHFDKASEGVMRRLHFFMDQQTKVTVFPGVTRGIDDGKIPGLEKTMTDLDKKISTAQKQMDAKQERLKQQFAKMQEAIQRSQASQQQLQQISGNSQN